MLHIIRFSYNANTAIANRLLGYYKEFATNQIKATVYYLFPDSKFSKISQAYGHLEVKYLWESKFFSYLPKVIYFIYALYSIRKEIKRGDCIYTYGIDRLTYFALKIKGVNVYAERTEHPKASSGIVSRLIYITEKQRQFVLRRISGLFVISEPLKEYYISEGVSAERIQILNMTVDPSRFYGLVKQQSERYIAYCGTISNNKDGVDELIKAFAIVAQQFNDIKLYIIGQVPNKDEESENIALIHKLGLDDRIVFPGIVSAENMPQVLKNAEIVVLARPNSLQAQCGFPTKLGEYLLSENPVVVTKVGDIPKFIQDGKTGLLAEERNPVDFANKLIWCLNNPQTAAMIGKRGAQLALREFNTSIETNKMLDFLRKHHGL